MQIKKFTHAKLGKDRPYSGIENLMLVFIAIIIWALFRMLQSRAKLLALTRADN